MTKKGLAARIREMRQSDVAGVIAGRLREFGEAGKSGTEHIFCELCFCLLTANFRAEKCMEIQQELGQGFLCMDRDELALRLKEAGHRFWPQRAERIVEARECMDVLGDVIGSGGFEARQWLVKNIKGLGMKEASHFLRNIGFRDLAIIDFHILDLMKREGLISFDRKKQSLTPKRYLEFEKILEVLAVEAGMDLAELDLWLWYMETGKVLK